MLILIDFSFGSSHSSAGGKWWWLRFQAYSNWSNSFGNRFQNIDWHHSSLSLVVCNCRDSWCGICGCWARIPLRSDRIVMLALLSTPLCKELWNDGLVKILLCLQKYYKYHVNTGKVSVRQAMETEKPRVQSKMKSQLVIAASISICPVTTQTEASRVPRIYNLQLQLIISEVVVRGINTSSLRPLTISSWPPRHASGPGYNETFCCTQSECSII